MWKAAFSGRSEVGGGSGQSSVARASSDRKKSRVNRAESVISSASHLRDDDKEHRRLSRPTSTYEHQSSIYTTAPHARERGPTSALTKEALRMLPNDDDEWEDDENDARTEKSRKRSSTGIEKGRRPRDRSEKDKSRSRSRDRKVHEGTRKKDSRSFSSSEKPREKGKDRESKQRDYAINNRIESSRGIPDMGSFDQFPGQYPGRPMYGVSNPQDAMMSGALPGPAPQEQFPVHEQNGYTRPHTSHLQPTRADSFGAAADYYQDQGESVQTQPGIRPHTPNMLVNPDHHLVAASAQANPAQDTGHGSAADFYSGKVSPVYPTPAEISTNEIKPSKNSKLSKPSKTGKPSSFSSSSKPSKPSRTSSIGLAALGTAAAAGIAAASTSHQAQSSSSQQQQAYTSYQTSNSYSSQAQNYESRPLGQDTNGNRYSNSSPQQVPSGKTGKKYSANSNTPLYAVGAAAAGLATHQMNQHNHSQTSQQIPFAGAYGGGGQGPPRSPRPTGLGSYPGSNTGAQFDQYHFHEHKGPMTRLKDGLLNLISSPEDVAKMEQYTEYIGVCKHCFDPRTSEWDAPRVHHYHRRRDSFEELRRRRSTDRLGRKSSNDSLRRTGSTRVDKENRYYAADSSRLRRLSDEKSSGLLGAGLAAVGVAAGANALFGQEKTFDDTYSVKSGHRESSAVRRRSRSSSRERRRRSIHGVVRPGGREEYVTVRRKDGTIEKRRVKRASHSRSRSRSIDRRNGFGAAVAGTALGASAATIAGISRQSRSRSRSRRRERRSPARPHQNGESDGFFGGFFSPPEKRRNSLRRTHSKKRRGFFTFSNSSASSTNSDMAFGDAYSSRTNISTAQRKHAKRTVRRNSDEHIAATIAGIGATAAALSAAQRHHRIGKRSSRPELGARREVRRQQVGSAYRRQSIGSSKSDDEWEDELPSDVDDESSVDEGLAFGDYGKRLSSRQSLESIASNSSAGGLGAWGWRWGGKDKKRHSRGATALPPSLNPSASVPLSKPLDPAFKGTTTGYAVDSSQRPVRPDHEPTDLDDTGRPLPGTMNSSQSIPQLPMQHVDPRPVSETGSQSHLRHQSMPGTFEPDPRVIRPGPAPLQQPQPIAPIQPTFTQSPPQMNSSMSSHTNRARRANSSPTQSTWAQDAALIGGTALATAGIIASTSGRKSRDSANVRFGFTEEQERKHDQKRRDEREKAELEERKRAEELRALKDEAERKARESRQEEVRRAREEDNRRTAEARLERERAAQRAREDENRKAAEARLERERLAQLEFERQRDREQREKEDMSRRADEERRLAARRQAELDEHDRQRKERERRDREDAYHREQARLAEQARQQEQSRRQWEEMAAEEAARVDAARKAEEDRKSRSRRNDEDKKRRETELDRRSHDQDQKQSRDQQSSGWGVLAGAGAAATAGAAMVGLSHQRHREEEKERNVAIGNQRHHSSEDGWETSDHRRGKTVDVQADVDREREKQHRRDLGNAHDRFATKEITPETTHESQPIMDDDIFDADLFKRKAKDDDYERRTELARKAADKVIADMDAAYNDKRTQADIFAPKELFEETSGYKTRPADANDDNQIQVYHARDAEIQSHFDSSRGGEPFGKSRHAPYGVPKLNLIAPTPPPDATRAYQLKTVSPSSPLASAQEVDTKSIEDDVRSQKSDRARSISWGVDQTHVYDAQTPEHEIGDDRDSYMTSPDVYAAVKDTSTSKASATDGHDNKDSASEDIPRDVSSHKGIEETLPDDQPHFSQFYRQPFYDSVSDVGFQLDSPGTEGAPPVRGFVEGETDEPTPAEEKVPQIPGGFDGELDDIYKERESGEDGQSSATYMKSASNGQTHPPYTGTEPKTADEPAWEPPLSKKEKKKREKAAKRSSTIDDEFAEPVSEPAPEPAMASVPEPSAEIDDDFTMSKKDRKKKAKAAKRASTDSASLANDVSSFDGNDKAANDGKATYEDEQAESKATKEGVMQLSKKEQRKLDKAAKKQGFADVAEAIMTTGGIAAVAGAATAALDSTEESGSGSSSNKKNKQAKKRLSEQSERDPRDIESTTKSSAHKSAVADLSSMPGAWDNDREVSQTIDKEAETPIEPIDPFQYQIHDEPPDTSAQEPDQWAEATGKKSKKKSKRNSVALNAPVASSPLRSEVSHDSSLRDGSSEDRDDSDTAKPVYTNEHTAANTLTKLEQGFSNGIGRKPDDEKRDDREQRNLPDDTRSAVSAPVESRSKLRRDESKANSDGLIEPLYAYETRSIAASEPADSYEGSRKSKRRSRILDDDDTASVTSSRSRREKEESPSAKKEKKGLLSSFFGRNKSPDKKSSSKYDEIAPLTNESIRESSKAGRDEDEDEGRHRRKKKHRDSETGNDDMDETRSVKSESLPRRHQSRSEHEDFDDDTRSVKSESRRKHHARDDRDDEDGRERRRRSLRDDEGLDHGKRAGSEGAERHHRRRRTDEYEVSSSRKGVNESRERHHHRRRTDEDANSSRDQSFLGRRVESLPPLPANNPAKPDSAVTSTKKDLGVGIPGLAASVAGLVNNEMMGPDPVDQSRSQVIESLPERHGPKDSVSDELAQEQIERIGLAEEEPAVPEPRKDIGSGDELSQLPALPLSRPGSPIAYTETPTRHIPIRVSSSTTVPLRLPGHAPSVTPRQTKERSISFSTPQGSTPSSPSPATPKGRGRASSEFRPLYLVERTRKTPEIMESLPSLPSSKPSSRASSVHGSDDYLSAAEDFGTIEKEPLGLNIDIGEANRFRGDGDYLDSQQTTPKASEFESGGEIPRQPRQEPQFYTWEDVIREQQMYTAADKLHISSHGRENSNEHSTEALPTGSLESGARAYDEHSRQDGKSREFPAHADLPPLPHSRPVSPFKPEYHRGGSLKGIAAAAMLGTAAVYADHALNRHGNNHLPERILEHCDSPRERAPSQRGPLPAPMLESDPADESSYDAASSVQPVSKGTTRAKEAEELFPSLSRNSAAEKTSNVTGTEVRNPETELITNEGRTETRSRDQPSAMPVDAGPAELPSVSRRNSAKEKKSKRKKAKALAWEEEPVTEKTAATSEISNEASGKQHESDTVPQELRAEHSPEIPSTASQDDSSLEIVPKGENIDRPLAREENLHGSNEHIVSDTLPSSEFANEEHNTIPTSPHSVLRSGTNVAAPVKNILEIAPPATEAETTDIDSSAPADVQAFQVPNLSQTQYPEAADRKRPEFENVPLSQADGLSVDSSTKSDTPIDQPDLLRTPVEAKDNLPESSTVMSSTADDPSGGNTIDDRGNSAVINSSVQYSLPFGMQEYSSIAHASGDHWHDRQAQVFHQSMERQARAKDIEQGDDLYEKPEKHNDDVPAAINKGLDPEEVMPDGRESKNAQTETIADSKSASTPSKKNKKSKKKRLSSWSAFDAEAQDTSAAETQIEDFPDSKQVQRSSHKTGLVEEEHLDDLETAQKSAPAEAKQADDEVFDDWESAPSSSKKKKDKKSRQKQTLSTFGEEQQETLPLETSSKTTRQTGGEEFPRLGKAALATAAAIPAAGILASEAVQAIKSKDSSLEAVQNEDFMPTISQKKSKKDKKKRTSAWEPEPEPEVQSAPKSEPQIQPESEHEPGLVERSDSHDKDTARNTVSDEAVVKPFVWPKSRESVEASSEHADASTSSVSASEATRNTRQPLDLADQDLETTGPPSGYTFAPSSELKKSKKNRKKLRSSAWSDFDTESDKFDSVNAQGAEMKPPSQNEGQQRDILQAEPDLSLDAHAGGVPRQDVDSLQAPIEPPLTVEPAADTGTVALSAQEEDFALSSHAGKSGKKDRKKKRTSIWSELEQEKGSTVHSQDDTEVSQAADSTLGMHVTQPEKVTQLEEGQTGEGESPFANESSRGIVDETSAQSFENRPGSRDTITEQPQPETEIQGRFVDDAGDVELSTPSSKKKKAAKNKKKAYRQQEPIDLDPEISIPTDREAAITFDGSSAQSHESERALEPGRKKYQTVDYHPEHVPTADETVEDIWDDDGHDYISSAHETFEDLDGFLAPESGVPSQEPPEIMSVSEELPVPGQVVAKTLQGGINHNEPLSVEKEPFRSTDTETLSLPAEQHDREAQDGIASEHVLSSPQHEFAVRREESADRSAAQPEVGLQAPDEGSKPKDARIAEPSELTERVCSPTVETSHLVDQLEHQPPADSQRELAHADTVRTSTQSENPDEEFTWTLGSKKKGKKGKKQHEKSHAPMKLYTRDNGADVSEPNQNFVESTSHETSLAPGVTDTELATETVVRGESPLDPMAPPRGQLRDKHSDVAIPLAAGAIAPLAGLPATDAGGIDTAADTNNDSENFWWNTSTKSKGKKGKKSRSSIVEMPMSEKNDLPSKSISGHIEHTPLSSESRPAPDEIALPGEALPVAESKTLVEPGDSLTVESEQTAESSSGAEPRAREPQDMADIPEFPPSTKSDATQKGQSDELKEPPRNIDLDTFSVSKKKGKKAKKDRQTSLQEVDMKEKVAEINITETMPTEGGDPTSSYMASAESQDPTEAEASDVWAMSGKGKKKSKKAKRASLPFSFAETSIPDRSVELDNATTDVLARGNFSTPGEQRSEDAEIGNDPLHVARNGVAQLPTNDTEPHSQAVTEEISPTVNLSAPQEPEIYQPLDTPHEIAHSIEDRNVVEHPAPSEHAPAATSAQVSSASSLRNEVDMPTEASDSYVQDQVTTANSNEESKKRNEPAHSSQISPSVSRTMREPEHHGLEAATAAAGTALASIALASTAQKPSSKNDGDSLAETHSASPRKSKKKSRKSGSSTFATAQTDSIAQETKQHEDDLSRDGSGQLESSGNTRSTERPSGTTTVVPGNEIEGPSRANDFGTLGSESLTSPALAASHDRSQSPSNVDPEIMEGQDIDTHVRAAIADESHMTEVVKNVEDGESLEDRDFSATVAAGLADSGFDPGLIMQDPVFRRKSSSPGGLAEADPEESFGFVNTKRTKKKKKGKSAEGGSGVPLQEALTPVPTDTRAENVPDNEFDSALSQTLRGTGFDPELLENVLTSSNERPGSAFADEPEFSLKTSKRKKNKKAQKAAAAAEVQEPSPSDPDVLAKPDSSPEAQNILRDLDSRDTLGLDVTQRGSQEIAKEPNASGTEDDGHVRQSHEPNSSNPVVTDKGSDVDIRDEDYGYKAYKKNKRQQKKQTASLNAVENNVDSRLTSDNPAQAGHVYLALSSGTSTHDKSVVRDDKNCKTEPHETTPDLREVNAADRDSHLTAAQSRVQSLFPGLQRVKTRTPAIKVENHAAIANTSLISRSMPDGLMHTSEVSQMLPASVPRTPSPPASASLERGRPVEELTASADHAAAKENINKAASPGHDLVNAGVLAAGIGATIAAADDFSSSHLPTKETNFKEQIKPSWLFASLRDEGIEVTKSPTLEVGEHRIARDSGYHEASRPSRMGRPSAEGNDERDESSRGSVTGDKDLAPLQIPKQSNEVATESARGFPTEDKQPHDDGNHSRKSSSATLLSPVSKNRASYLFQSPPENPATTPAAPTAPQTPTAGSDELEARWSPSRDNSQERKPHTKHNTTENGAHTNPSQSARTLSPRSPLGAIPEEHHGPKRSKAASDVGGPAQAKIVKRTETPQAFRMQERAVSEARRSQGGSPDRSTPRAVSNPLSTDTLINRLPWPAVNEENDTVNIDRSLSREVSRPTAIPAGDARSPSVMSNRSVSNSAHFRSPDELRSYSRASNRSSTPTLRRRNLSGDLRAENRRGDSGSTVGLRSSSTNPPFEPPPTPPLQDEDLAESASRAANMSDVFGYGDAQGSSVSPTRPPSVRKRQSMHISELESRLDQLVAENRALQEAKGFQFDSHNNVLQEEIAARDVQIREKDAEINQINALLLPMQAEISRLNEINSGLTDANRNLVDDSNGRYATLQSKHSNAHEQWQIVTQERDSIVSTLAEKDAEISRLRENLHIASEKIRALQVERESRRTNDFLVDRDEDYFDGACQKLCQHVQQWVLRFSKVSDNRICRLSSDLDDEKIETRLDNALLDGSDVDKLLVDRVRRRDVFMSVVMTMVWEYIFTRYLFGMDREQRQKLKALEKILAEVGPPRAVAHWRATTLTLLAKRPAFAAQADLDTEAVVHEIFGLLRSLLPPPASAEQQLLVSLQRVIGIAVDLSIEMRTQRAEYIMLPPLQPEYDTNGDLVRKVHFNAALMNERSGLYSSNEELANTQAVVKIVLFPLVVKKGDDTGEGEEEIVVCPAQVLVHHDGGRGKKVVRVMSGAMEIDSPSIRNRQSRHSIISEAPGSIGY